MSAEWNSLITLYNIGVRGTQPEPPQEDIDWTVLLTLAHRQAVRGVVCQVLKNAPFVPEDIRAQCRRTAITLCVKNSARADAVLQTLQLLREAGLTAAVLKGWDVGRFYALPETRTSADTDLLILPEEEEKVYAVLTAQGFQTKARKKGEHHGKASRGDTGILELHTKLWSDRTAQTLFGKNAERVLAPKAFRTVPFNDAEITVLQAQDALVYLTAHFVRHFVEPGAGLRQVYDLGLFFAENRDQIDANAFWLQMQAFGFDTLLQTALTFLTAHGCFEASDFPGFVPVSPEAVQAFDDDLMHYAANGKDADKTVGVWDYYCANRRAKSAEAKVRVTGMRVRDRMQVVFPKKTTLEKTYPFLNERPLLYPVAWVRRSVGALTDTERRKTAAKWLDMKPDTPVTDASEDAEKRVELLRKTGLL